MSEMSSARLLTPAFVALTLSDLAYFGATGVLIAATPLFVTGPLDSDEAGVGLAMGSFSVSTLLLRPLAGRWTDRRGRRGLLVGGATMFTVVVLGHYLVTGLAGLIALRLVLGAAEAMYFVAVFAALAAFASLLATRVPETRPTVDPKLAPAPLLHRAAIVPGLGLFCGVAVMAGFLAFAVLVARAVGIEAWSVVLLVFGSTVVVCRVAFAKLPDRVAPLGLTAAALGGWIAASRAVGRYCIGPGRSTVYPG
jgi:MFS family permease